jgi:hypothetical protein
LNNFADAELAEEVVDGLEGVKKIQQDCWAVENHLALLT